ncbi:MAG TPA: hypothetical protein VEN78_24490 [Bradyrhizobium sp.]|nr:hypothetical protein [Bradyrhizobium sp.]
MALLLSIRPTTVNGQVSDETANDGEAPVRIEQLGENWQYARDADKLPLIRKALASGLLHAPSHDDNRSAFCKTFPRDLLAGRFEVIEPEFQVLSADDPRLGERVVQDTPEGVRELSMDDPRVHWHRCDAINREDSTAREEYQVFMGLELLGVPPYRFYRIELDGNPRNGPEEVVLSREHGNGYSHDYAWVKLKGCEIRRNVNVSSPRAWLKPDARDALSLLIRYRGRHMILDYTDWAKRGETQTKVSVYLTDFRSLEYCKWGDPFKH